MNYRTKITEDITTFIRSGPTGDDWPKRAVLIVNDTVYSSEPCKDKENSANHAEAIALKSLEEEEIEEGEEFVMYINHSPCHKCANKILAFQEEHRAQLVIRFANVYYGEDRGNSIGLEKLNRNAEISLHTIQGSDWKNVIQKIATFHGGNDWKSVLEKIIKDVQGDGWQIAIRKINNDDKQENWEERLLQIFQDNQTNELGAMLSEFLRDHGLGDLKGELKWIVQDHKLKDWEKSTQILRFHEENQWENMLKYSLEKNGIKHLKGQLTSILLEQSNWQTELRQILQMKKKIHLFNVIMQILLHRYQFHHVLKRISPCDREGYAWLQQVLCEFGITVKQDWLGRRVIADYAAGQELNCILQDRGRIFRTQAPVL